MFVSYLLHFFIFLQILYFRIFVYQMRKLITNFFFFEKYLANFFSAKISTKNITYKTSLRNEIIQVSIIRESKTYIKLVVLTIN